jgi:hypothetical protein
MSTSPSQSDNVGYHFEKNDSVTLIMGPEQHEMLVHANFIARESDGFKTVLKEEWRKGQIRTIVMPEEDYGTMTKYINFVYGEWLPKAPVADPASKESLKDDMEEFYCSLAEPHVLGGGLLDKFLKNAVLEEIVPAWNLSSDISSLAAYYSCQIVK